MSNSVQSQNSTPLEQLQLLASLSMGDAAIEQPEKTQEEWRGFTFNVGDLNLVFPFMGGFEILPERDIQPIPWVQSWVRGVTNVRGEVYSVVDIGAYLGFTAVRSMRSATLFRLPDAQLKSAILLDSKVSLKSFPEELEHLSGQKLPSRLSRCVSTSVVIDQDIWHVIDVTQLCNDQDFVAIAEESQAFGDDVTH
ncbi:MAG: chemotaxis protein CheW [Acidiferrobacterales bacterium]|nr:chemotaxis protein CheW [Acidiferrobacterales bacterium]